MIERIFDLGTDGLVDRLAGTPNGYWVAAELALVAAASSVCPNRSGNLLPLDNDADVVESAREHAAVG